MRGNAFLLLTVLLLLVFSLALAFPSFMPRGMTNGDAVLAATVCMVGILLYTKDNDPH